MSLRHKAALTAFAGLALGLAACHAGKPQRPACPAGQVCLEYGDNSEPLTLDPQKSNLVDEGVIISDLMVGLTTDAADGSPVPGAATHWETSADGLTWTFHLRPGALWSDSRPVTADDFVYGLRRVLDPRTSSISARLAYVLKNGRAVNEGKAPLEALGVRARDPLTLELLLEQPTPYLPQLLRHPNFFPAPRRLIETYGDAWVKPGRFVGNGPFRLIAWRLGDHLQVEKSPTFWDAAKVCIDRIDYHPTSDSVAAERRVERGELDINASFQSNRLARIREVAPGVPRAHASLATYYLSFNTRDVKALQDIRVRRALSESIDRDFITAKLLRAGQVPAYSFVPPGTANYPGGAKFRWAAEPLAQRLIEARGLLTQAGYSPSHPLIVEIKTSNKSDNLLISQAIQADWAAIGVQSRIVQNESQIAFAAYRNRDFQVGLMDWTADFNDPTTFLGLMKSDVGAQNYGDYRNAEYDAALARAEAEPDVARRGALLAGAEQRLLDDEGTAPLFFMVNRNLVSSRVTGWVDNVEDFHRARWLCVR